MNILVLTPDAVGSTLLQRLITIYLQLNDIDRPVINLHELTNGLGVYWSPDFNREIVSKRPVKNWGYFQTLEEVVGMLEKTDHYKVSRLAHYHIINRGDSIEQQIPFYDYLDRNFYIIACRRQNVFEHALSLTLARSTKKLNVYTPHEKINTFADLYQTKVRLDLDAFQQCLDRYELYIDWSLRYFNVSSYFTYEKDLPRIEDFILGLPIFGRAKPQIGWHQAFGSDFNTYNRCHYLHSDIGSLFLAAADPRQVQLVPHVSDQEKLTIYQQQAPAEWPPAHSPDDLRSLPIEIQKEFHALYRYQALSQVAQLMDDDTRRYLQINQQSYRAAAQAIQRMVDLDVLVSGPPIKKQTLREKKYMIENFQECLDLYNAWVSTRPNIGRCYDSADVNQQCDDQARFWSAGTVANLPISAPLQIKQS